MDLHINLDQSVQSEPRLRLQLAENLLRDIQAVIHRLEVNRFLQMLSPTVRVKEVFVFSLRNQSDIHIGTQASSSIHDMTHTYHTHLHGIHDARYNNPQGGRYSLCSWGLFVCVFVLPGLQRPLF